jgi:hypothetical protein
MSLEQIIASLRAPALVDIANHWNAARGSKRMPAWSNIDPAAIRAHLPVVWAWRFDAVKDTFIGRLAGQTIVEAIEGQIRGRVIEDCFPESSVPVLRERLARVLAGPALMWAYGLVYVTSGRRGFGERLGLPLSEDGVRADGIFGATVYTFDTGAAPPRERLERDISDEVVEFFAL